ncbi:hypothetical protein MMC26_004278 [Xylographa opegraphella]|nr:hypothetical protein [Xylographa opegraphella]
MFLKSFQQWPSSLAGLSHPPVRYARDTLSKSTCIFQAQLHLQSRTNPRRSHRLPPQTAPSPRLLSTTPPLLKKGQRDEPKRTVEKAAARSEAADNDPYDFSALDAGIDHALERLTDDLAKLKPGGRFNPDMLEALRVSLVKGSRDTVKLADVAQVVPRGGRTVVVLVGEADVSPFYTDLALQESSPLQSGRVFFSYRNHWLTAPLFFSPAQHVKPITSAILASPYSLNPVPAPQSPLELLVPVPPATQESRQQTLAAASKAGEAAGHAVRQARGAQQKVLRSMELARTVRPDDLKKAKERMEKVVERGNEEVKRRVEGARRVLERG